MSQFIVKINDETLYFPKTPKGERLLLKHLEDTKKKHLSDPWFVGLKELIKMRNDDSYTRSRASKKKREKLKAAEAERSNYEAQNPDLQKPTLRITIEHCELA